MSVLCTKKYGPLFFIAVLGLLPAALACQPVVHSADPDASGQTTCRPGQWFCDDGLAKHCGELGYVIERVECYPLFNIPKKKFI